MASPTRFPIRFGMFRHGLIALGAGPKRSGVWIDGERMRVRLGPAFTANVALASVKKVGPDHQMVTGIGAHGWRGNWLVNGAASDIVRVELDPAGQARVLGFPVKLRVLRVSMESPEAFMAALADARR
ncbi:MAG: hypothetical protein ACR2HM_07520 [Acidimicrobiales bacterium]